MLLITSSSLKIFPPLDFFHDIRSLLIFSYFLFLLHFPLGLLFLCCSPNASIPRVQPSILFSFSTWPSEECTRIVLSKNGVEEVLAKPSNWLLRATAYNMGEGNGNPLQCSCLENPRDGGAWWAVVYGVAQSRTRLKRLSSSSSIQPMTLYLLEFLGIELLACF